MTDVRQEMVALLPRLRRFAYALTGSKDDADDVVQAACERALSRLSQFTPGTRLDSWMLRIVHSVAIDGFRRNRRMQPVDPVEFNELADTDDRAQERLEARSTLSLVRVAFAALPDDQRAVLALVVLEGRTYREAAEALGVPVGTIMSRLARARKRLADTVGEPIVSGEAGKTPRNT